MMERGSEEAGEGQVEHLPVQWRRELRMMEAVLPTRLGRRGFEFLVSGMGMGYWPNLIWEGYW